MRAAAKAQVARMNRRSYGPLDCCEQYGLCHVTSNRLYCNIMLNSRSSCTFPHTNAGRMLQVPGILHHRTMTSCCKASAERGALACLVCSQAQHTC